MPPAGFPALGIHHLGHVSIFLINLLRNTYFLCLQEIAAVKVNVVGSISRGETLVLKAPQLWSPTVKGSAFFSGSGDTNISTMVNLPAYAQFLLSTQESCYVDFPYLTEAQVPNVTAF